MINTIDENVKYYFTSSFFLLIEIGYNVQFILNKIVTLKDFFFNLKSEY